MTKGEWRKELERLQVDLKRECPHKDGQWILERSLRIMRDRHGPEPAGIPLKARLVAWWLRRELSGVRSMEVSMLWKKVVVSLLYGIGAAAAAVQAALVDGAISGEEWMPIVSALVVAFWGKFSSNTTVVAASRKGETVAGPKP